MKKRRGKYKRDERGSTEDEVNSAKKPNMEKADGTNNDSEVEESEVNFYELAELKSSFGLQEIQLNPPPPRESLNKATKANNETRLLVIEFFHHIWIR